MSRSRLWMQSRRILISCVKTFGESDARWNEKTEGKVWCGSYPKCICPSEIISIAGSVTEAQEARALLLGNYSPTQQADDCAVCWTEATEPVKTSCGHVYCRDCFANQA